MAPDAHLVSCVARWEHELVFDQSPFLWWTPDGEPAVAATLRGRLAEHAPARLRAAGEPDLALRTGLLARTYDGRWAHPYGHRPSPGD
ncbi:hypothetical protein [Streptomyces sp. DSM 15324]|uniref:hypothetical protein n=1 Tax=Streptomyces sp. DSM 15324 TaxID=1739111 RepID=UPI000749D185|nr:hypothetical protein [Streptomyces sp. DSM 15324]KUO11110.1 hypothetical protein AQJ58_16340 [Streptomyces sp. DSM 15324]